MKPPKPPKRFEAAWHGEPAMSFWQIMGIITLVGGVVLFLYLLVNYG